MATLAITAGMVVLPSPAQAADWSQDIQGVVRADRLFTHPDGKVTVAACGAPSGDSLQAKTYDTTGSTSYVNEVANSNSPKLYACMGQSTIGKDGTLYASGYYSGQSYERLVAYKDNAQKWNVQLPNSCSTFHSIAMGVNGNVYVIGGSCSGSTYRLIGFTPEVASGQTVPSVVLNVAVNNYFGGSSEEALAAFDQGLVVQLNNGLQYFDYSGSFASVNPVNFRRPLNGALAANHSGRSFYPIANTQNGCSPSWGIMASINMTPVSGNGWSFPLPNCTQVWQIRPTFDGGAVAIIHRFGSEEGRYLLSITPDGLERWSHLYDAPNFDEGITSESINTTVNGDVVLQRSYDLRHPTNPVNGRGIRITLIGGFTGTEVRGVALKGTNQGYAFAESDANGGIANGRIYFAARACNIDACTGNKNLYAVDLAGSDIDYPRGAIYAHGNPWLEYVAMGDSFSSGEGVPAYENGTDVAGPPENRCHRSEVAYSRLLNGNPKLRWNLTNFVACSGATSTDIINGKYGEPSQLDALSLNTKVITITVGGNDVGFEPFARKCVGMPPANPFDVCDAGSTEYNVTIDKMDNELPDNLVSTTPGDLGVFRRIKAKSPNAQIYVLGYPQLSPFSTEPHTWPWCAWMGSESEHVAAREIVTRLNLRIKQAVQVMQSENAAFHFIDPNIDSSPFVGHELCDGDTYFNGVEAINSEHSIHPNAKGQDAYRRLVLGNS